MSNPPNSGAPDSFLSTPLRLPFLPKWMSVSTAMAIMMAVFFLVPFIMRGARMSLERMKNDVKDWLPADFQETKDLDWFRNHFLGEQFVVCTWDGCTGTADDKNFRMFLQELIPEPPPSAHDKYPLPDPTDPKFFDKDLNLYIRQLSVDDAPWRKDFIGDKLGLYVPMAAEGADAYHTDWGGRSEKWLKGYGGYWYFIVPVSKAPTSQGKPGDAPPPSENTEERYALYQWDGTNSLLGGAYRSMVQKVAGVSAASGKYLMTFPVKDGPWYYDNPHRLSGQWFKTITTGPATLSRLTRNSEKRITVEEKEARQRLQGMLFGKVIQAAKIEGDKAIPEVRQTCMILTLTDAAKRDLHQAVGRGILGKPQGQLQRAAIKTGKLNLHLGGPPVDNVAIDEEGQITLVHLIGYSAAVGLVLSYILLRSFLQTLMVFFVGAIGAVLSLSIVYWTGGSVDAVLLTMPSLVYVLGISGTIHIINNYMLTAREHGHRGAPEHAAWHSFPPQFFCAITTALGLLSLLSSNIVPISKFGWYSALGTLGTVVILFTYLPAALEVWPTAKRRLHPGETADPADEDVEANEPEEESGWFHEIRTRLDYVLEAVPHAICAFLLRNYTAAAIICTAITFALGYGVVYLRTEVNLLKMFDASTDIIRDYTWLEDNLGKLVPMEIVIRVAPEAKSSDAKAGEAGKEKNKNLPAIAQDDGIYQLDFLERMEAAAMIRAMLESEFGDQGRGIVGAVTSVDTFVPNLPPPESATARSTMARILEKHRDELVGTDYLRDNKDEDDKGAELWRISLRLAALKNVDYGQFVGALESGIEPMLKAYPKRLEILQSVTRVTEGERLHKQNILILGANYHQYDQLDATRRAQKAKIAQAESTGQKDGDKPAEKTEEEKQQALDQNYASRPLDAADQTRLFAMQLRHLLIGSRANVTWYYPDNPAGKKRPVNDYDLYTPKDGEGWIERLEAQKCVVLVGDGGYDLDQIKKHCPNVIDCRDHQFKPGLDAVTARGLKETTPEGDVKVKVPAEPIHAIYTGLVPVVYKAQRTLLESLNDSFIWSLLTITPTMMFILIPGRNLLEKLHPVNIWYGFMGGVVAMLPNTFPIAIVFGVMGYMGVVIDIGTMMTASVAVGIAVDDTIHFLTYFRDGLNEGKTKEEAILEGYKKCAVSFIQTAVICGVGLGVFAFSTFTPTQRFGIMMLVLLLTAVFGDLLFLPALLAGPFGWFFRPNPMHEGEESQHETAEIAGKALPTEPFLPATEKTPPPETPPAATPPPDLVEPVADDQESPAEGNGNERKPDDAEENGDGSPSTRHSGLRNSGSRAFRHDNPHQGMP